MQCQASVLSIEAVYDVLMAITVDTALTKSMCVDSVGSNIWDYIMTHSYETAPIPLQPLLMSMVAEQRSDTYICESMLNTTRKRISEATQPWFTAQFASTEALGNSVDYLLKFAGDKDAGRCLDFSRNPHTTVLIPTPVDYFRVCGNTNICKLKCKAEFETMQELLDQRSAYGTNLNYTATMSSESNIFLSAQYAPMKILALMQLRDCNGICSTVGDKSRDICVAVAGLLDLSIAVQKYCIPAQFGSGVYIQQAHSWAVRADKAHVKTVVKMAFADKGVGDMLVILRDNSAPWDSTLATGEFVTLHKRHFPQHDEMLLDVRSMKFDTIASIPSAKVATEKGRAIADMLVIQGNLRLLV
jgi:hypothetical protein